MTSSYKPGKVWTKVTASRPVDRVAARVIRKGIRHDVAPRDPNDTERLPWMRPFDEFQNRNLTGKRFGRLCVFGLEWGGKSTEHGSLWVVRCDCGMYSLRRSNCLGSGNDMCSACQYVARLRDEIAAGPQRETREQSPLTQALLPVVRRQRLDTPAVNVAEEPDTPLVTSSTQPALVTKIPAHALSELGQAGSVAARLSADARRVLGQLCSFKTPRTVRKMVEVMRNGVDVGAGVGSLRVYGCAELHSKTKKTWQVTTFGREVHALLTGQGRRSS